jgi:hypothetical protein
MLRCVQRLMCNILVVLQLMTQPAVTVRAPPAWKDNSVAKVASQSVPTLQANLTVLNITLLDTVKQNFEADVYCAVTGYGCGDKFSDKGESGTFNCPEWCNVETEWTDENTVAGPGGVRHAWGSPCKWLLACWSAIPHYLCAYACSAHTKHKSS